jgi:ribosome-associated protein
LTLAKQAREALLDKKAEDVVILDVRDLSTVTDYYLVATGNNGPHLKSLATELSTRLNEDARRFRRTGKPESGWLVSDYVDVVVHIFSPEMRKRYALEQLWNDAPRVK